MTNDSVGYSQFLVMHRVLLSPGTDTVIPGDSLERPQGLVWVPHVCCLCSLIVKVVPRELIKCRRIYYIVYANLIRVR